MAKSLESTASNNKPSQLERLINSLPGHSFLADVDGRLIHCNQQFAETFGYSSNQEITGQPLQSILPPQTSQQILSNNAFVFNKGESISIEENWECKSANKTLLTKKSLYFLRKNGKPYLLSISFDISGRKQLEQELYHAKLQAEKALQEKDQAMTAFRSVISLMPGHIFWKDSHGRYLGCNKQQLLALELESEKDLIGKTFQDIYPNLDTQTVKNNDQKILDGTLKHCVEEFTVHTSKGVRVFLTEKVPLYGADNKITGIIAISFDITKQKQAEEEIKKAHKEATLANQAKTQFIANMSHDLRTPLHTLLGMSEILKHQKHYPEQEEVIDNILAAGKTILNLVEDILDFSKLEANQIHLSPQNIKLKELLKSLLIAFQNQVKNPNLKLSLDFDESIPSAITCDPEVLRRILSNLLTNAIKFTEIGKVIISAQVINIEANKASIQFSVEDTGVGISEENLTHIFERFYRVNPSYKTRYKGSGLGLAISKQLIEMLGSTLNVNSRLGHGSIFYFTLTMPISQEMQSANEATLGEKQFPLKVLLVDDDPLAQKVSKSILTELGCNVETVASGEEAVEKKAPQYDIIFMDIGLPKMDGLETTKQIHQRFPELTTPIYALTAHASDADKEKCLNIGMHGFIIKPASYAKFQQVLKEISGC